MHIDFISLIKNSKANIPNKKELIDTLRTNSLKANVRETNLNLKEQENFQRYGNIVINLSLFKSLKKDAYEYFKDKGNYYDLNNDNDFKRLKKILESNKNVKHVTNNSTVKPNEDNSIDQLKDKYPNIYEKYHLEEFNNFSYIDQGRVLSEISSGVNSLSQIYPYLKIGKSSGTKRIKAYKIFCSFPEEQECLNTLSYRTLEAFPSDYELQKKIIEQIKVEKDTKINREYILNFRKTICFEEPEKILNQNLVNLKEILDSKRFRGLSNSDQSRIIKYFDKIDKIIKKNNII